MKSTTRFRVNAPKVIHEIIDGEAVLVHLDTGAYYSMDKVGAVIWDQISNSMAVGQIVDFVDNHCTARPKEIERGIADFVTQLQEEDLIALDNENQPNHSSSTSTNQFHLTNAENIAECRYEHPVLHKYTDMEDLLLLDPIHDVDDTGWPNTNPKNK